MTGGEVETAGALETTCAADRVGTLPSSRFARRRVAVEMDDLELEDEYALFIPPHPSNGRMRERLASATATGKPGGVAASTNAAFAKVHGCSRHGDAAASGLKQTARRDGRAVGWSGLVYAVRSGRRL